ncbi:polyketide synthase [Falsiroseomonas tokyonensis]|uniref:Polyketide synthase n=1 Tax=Falsiroseomonas tokyonensis TaxID=430521 RepID=A0ABV7BME1_9PROT|nr:enoyl-CoA hydratase/isomerase family protein [Falsiroseomonas tokyonensis]
MEDAVALHWQGEIAIVTLQDRAGRNTFSVALVSGLAAAFAAIEANPAAKVVVLHGAEGIFCAGGTLEELIGIADGRQKFDEAGFYRMLLDCPLPVISAMDGHALGGGLVFGLYADLSVLAVESLYATNFMKYGFTPGMGATLIVPHRLGNALANEMLFTANGYHGGALRERGLGLPVVKRAEVLPTALRLARDLAAKPAVALRLLKAALATPIRDALPAAVAREQAMHEVTFAQPGIHQQIRSRFGA